MNTDLQAINAVIAAAVARAVVSKAKAPASDVVQINCLVQVETIGETYEVSVAGAIAIDLRIKAPQ